ncbi:MAG: transposase [Planctomycetes bacterium]|nr:transposase [Planctomycetota bacterium]
MSNTYLRQARRRGMHRSNTGAVVFDQRFDSAIRLDLHFHSLVPDGVFTCAPGQARADFHDADELTDAEVARTIRHIHRRVLRQLRRLGKLDDADADAQDPDVLLQLHAAAVKAGPHSARTQELPTRGPAAAPCTCSSVMARAACAPTSTASACMPPCAFAKAVPIASST